MHTTIKSGNPILPDPKRGFDRVDDNYFYSGLDSARVDFKNFGFGLVSS